MIIAKTKKGLEFIVKSILEEKNIKCEAKPSGYLGVLFIFSDNLEEVLKIPEVENAYIVNKIVEADLDEIEKACRELAKELKKEETFAVETVRRGRHGFTSIDVNIRCGKAVQEESGCEVNLVNPDKVFRIEIFNEKAFIILTDKGRRKKITPDKKISLEFFKKVNFVQLAYWGSLQGCYEMGLRIGRAAQAFEINRLYISLSDEINGKELKRFLDGVFEGIEARAEIQKKTYSRKVKTVDVYVDNMYQLIRKINPKKNLIIITDPTGDQLSKIKEKIRRDLYRYKRIYIFAGSREGVPKGLFRFAHYVIDLSPGITFATEHTIPASLIALYTILSEKDEENGVENG